MSGPVPMVTGTHGCAQGIWDITTDPQLTVGTRGVLPDGRVFYYARQSSANAIVAGKLLVASVKTGFDQLVIGVQYVGDTAISFTSGSGTASANDFAEGYMATSDDTGEGITYKVRSHAAISATTASTLTIYDGIAVQTGAATTVTLVQNPWMDPVISVADQADMPVGISNVAVSAGNSTPYYYWCQTWGVCAALSDEAITEGGMVVTGESTVGAVQLDDGAAEAIVGIAIVTTVDTEYQPVFLKIAP